MSPCRGDQPGSSVVAVSRWPRFQVWRAEVAFSRPEADQAVCCQALLALTGRALGAAGSE